MEVGHYLGMVGGLALAFIAFIRIFLMRQITDLRSDVDRLTAQMSSLRKQYDESRAEKHKARNDVARTVMALELVQRLAKECKCGVLSPVQEIVDRMMDELETIGRRRHDDTT